MCLIFITVCTECCFRIIREPFVIVQFGFINFRYDARGTLFDLKIHEAPQGGFDRTEGLTSEERRLEGLCDQERYFALYKDEAEEAVIKEEEIKRLNQDLNEVTSEEVTYNQVPFSYAAQQVYMLRLIFAVLSSFVYLRESQEKHCL